MYHNASGVNSYFITLLYVCVNPIFINIKYVVCDLVVCE